MSIDRFQAIALFGSAPKLAAALGYNSRSAVYNWPARGAIPHEPYMRLRYEVKPEAFDADGNLRPEYKAAVNDAKSRSRKLAKRRVRR